MENKIRIIAGFLKGRGIETMPGSGTRPLLARVKKSLFDILNPAVFSARFLDLFAGSGAVGFEALSRGAAGVVMVESSCAALKIIEKNAANLDSGHKCRIVKEAVENYLESCDEKFDIIFTGPPYYSALNSKLLEIIGRNNILREKGILVYQQHKSEEYTESCAGLLLYRTEKYGDMLLLFYRNERS